MGQNESINAHKFLTHPNPLSFYFEPDNMSGIAGILLQAANAGAQRHLKK